ncbi:DUF192 domain-containing protein [Flavobacteriaceae bacterium M23B6Z8]
MRNSLYLFGIVLSLLLTVSCKNQGNTNQIINQEVTFSKEGSLQIIKSDSITVLDLEIEIADNDYEIETGLMYRKKMRKDRGMLFIFPNEEPRYFYMKNTEIPLDLIFINAENKIVSVTENTTPFDETTLPASAPAQYVLEINAGLVSDHNITVGDVVRFTKN